LLILVTNDDGVHAPGIAVLAETLRALGRVVVIAPDRDRSAVGHALTLHAPLRADPIGPDLFAVDGTPTDCVNLGVHGLIEASFDLVVSGINQGPNLGDDITYSGTVSAAMEATLMGVPAMAVSLDGDASCRADFCKAGRVAKALAEEVLHYGLPRDTFLNVNVPGGDIRGMRLTRQGRRRYRAMVVEKQDPRGRKYYWLGNGGCEFDRIEGTDCHALGEGYISVTPLHLDLTNYRSFVRLEKWNRDFAAGDVFSGA
jgi:5'-nucleotidase